MGGWGVIRSWLLSMCSGGWGLGIEAGSSDLLDVHSSHLQDRKMEGLNPEGVVEMGMVGRDEAMKMVCSERVPSV